MTLTTGPGDSTQVVKDVARLKEALKNTPDRGAAEIERYLQSQGATPVDEAPPSMKQEIHGGSAAFLQGAGLNVPGLISPDLRHASEDFGKRHNILGPVLKGAGTVATSMLAPEVWGAKWLGRALLGGGAAAVDAGAAGDGTVAERLKRAGTALPVGAVAGAAIPPTVGLANKFVGKLIKPLMPERTVAKAVGALLPADAAAKMARIEQLAPGTGTVAALSPEIPASTRVIGANPGVALKAEDAAITRLGKLKTALQGMSPQYQQVLTNNGQPITAPLAVRGGPNIVPTLVRNGHLPTNSTSLETVQALRNTIRAKKDALWITAQKGKGGGPKVRDLNEDYKNLTQWLEYHAPGVAKLDADYRVLNDARRAEETVLKNIKQSRKAYASSRAAGIEPGSPGASVPTKGGLLHTLFSSDRKALAAAADKLLLQPGQIPTALLKARAAAVRGPSGRPGLLGAMGLGAAAGDLNDQLSGLLGP